MRLARARTAAVLLGGAIGLLSGGVLLAPLAGCGSCPLEAEQCPEGCAAIRAFRYSAESGCLEPVSTIGCSSARGGTGDVACLRQTEDGDLHAVTSGSLARELAGSPRWAECSEEEVEVVASASACD